ncbi:MAG: DUF2339 domain-containing protein [Planctomycetota bacterium]|jgi:hypothetical protein
MGGHKSESVDEYLAGLQDDLRSLERKVDGLDRRIAALESSETSTVAEEAPRFEFEESESLWSWIGQSRFLPRIAIVCFVLVVALGLRTLSDSGTIPFEWGVMLGMVYSTGLVALGWIGLARQRRGRTVLPASGAVLMCAIVLEAYGSLSFLSATQANLILLATLAVLSLLGTSYGNGAVIAFGVLSPALSALILGFPNPEFPYTAGVLLAANIAALIAANKRLSWLPFATFGLTLFFWLLWGFKTNGALKSEDPVPVALFPDWFMPLLIAFAALFVVAATLRAFARPKSPGLFNTCAPTLNVLWAFSAALAVMPPALGQSTVLGVTGVIVALAHFGVAAVLWRRIRECADGITAFAMAGAVLLTIAVVSAASEMIFVLPIWAVVAFGIGTFSTVCGSSCLRILGYVLQGLACVVAIAGATFALPSSAPLLTIAAAAVLTAMAALQFRWMRSHPPPEASWLARLDPAGRQAIGLFWFAAIYAFLLLRLLSYAGIEAVGVDVDNTFRCSQSVIINVASIVLMWWALRERDKDILATAVLVAAVGGLKVFISDLQDASGIPLVAAVFSFGLAAAYGSVVVKKWQAATVASKPTDPESP